MTAHQPNEEIMMRSEYCCFCCRYDDDESNNQSIHDLLAPSWHTCIESNIPFRPLRFIVTRLALDLVLIDSPYFGTQAASNRPYNQRI